MLLPKSKYSSDMMSSLSICCIHPARNLVAQFCSLLETGLRNGSFLGTYRFSHVSAVWLHRLTSTASEGFVVLAWHWWCRLGPLLFFFIEMLLYPIGYFVVIFNCSSLCMCVFSLRPSLRWCVRTLRQFSCLCIFWPHRDRYHRQSLHSVFLTFLDCLQTLLFPPSCCTLSLSRRAVD